MLPELPELELPVPSAIIPDDIVSATSGVRILTSPLAPKRLVPPWREIEPPVEVSLSPAAKITSPPTLLELLPARATIEPAESWESPVVIMMPPLFPDVALPVANLM